MVNRLAQVWLLVTSPTKVTVGAAPPQLSVPTVTLVVLAAGTWLAHCTVTGAEQEIVGAMLSTAV